jgi:hypothetical protein
LLDAFASITLQSVYPFGDGAPWVLILRAGQ